MIEFLTAAQLFKMGKDFLAGAEDPREVGVRGTVTFRNRMRKRLFLRVRTESHEILIYADEEEVGQLIYRQLTALQIDDRIRVKGNLARMLKGELVVRMRHLYGIEPATDGLRLETVRPIGLEQTLAFLNNGPDWRTHTRERVDVEVFPTPLPEAVAVHDARMEARLTLGELSRALGISVSQLSGLENGRFVPLDEAGWQQIQNTINNLGEKK